MGLFDRVEQRLERAVGGAFARAFKSEVQPVEIASAIRRAMDDRAAILGHGRTMVPNLYTVELSETDYERLSAYDVELERELVAAAQEHADSQRYQPGGPIQVGFTAAEDLETGVFRLRTSTARRPGGSTGGHHPLHRRPLLPSPPRGTPLLRTTGSRRPRTTCRSPPAPPRRVNPADRPWLDVDGERYPLMGAMTVLGRDDSADIILDDPGISRRHSEIRVTTDGPTSSPASATSTPPMARSSTASASAASAWRTATGSPSGGPPSPTAPVGGDCPA